MFCLPQNPLALAMGRFRAASTSRALNAEVECALPASVVNELMHRSHGRKPCPDLPTDVSGAFCRSKILGKLFEDFY